MMNARSHILASTHTRLCTNRRILGATPTRSISTIGLRLHCNHQHELNALALRLIRRCGDRQQYSSSLNILSSGARNGQIALRRRRHWPTSTYSSLRHTAIESVPFVRNIHKRNISTGSFGQFRRKAWQEITNRPIEFFSVPCVAAFVGILTNWMGVKMLFYPVEYQGLELKRWEKTPYGLFGWQGVVPTKTDLMAKRLVKIITDKLLSLDEAFGRMDPNELGQLLLPGIEDSVDSILAGSDRMGGKLYSWGVKQLLPLLMPHLVTSLKLEIDQVLDLEKVVLSAFLRDKATLVDLFRKVGQVELDFLVNSGFGLGFVLGLGQMVCWAAHPVAWTLPAAGALVGYVTNWIAIRMIFEPAEPVEILGGLFEIQGMFESRQIEVSDEFGDFMQRRVLTAGDLLKDLASGGDEGELFKFLRRHLPYPIPSEILSAAVVGVAEIAADPIKYADVHKYVNERLDIRDTLARRLKTLSPTEFEDLLHPVFQEDELTLIATGGVLGLAAGGLQTQLGWGGTNAVPRAIGTIVFTLVSSLFFFLEQEYELEHDEPLASTERPQLRRCETVVRRRTNVPEDRVN
mmetsp:Transcript_5448/g.10520  ORF Transcript_5448/g.10520 Transcript_5448/m.10520 type:complete len:575 (-) Transcript_5448:1146-2870(-)